MFSEKIMVNTQIAIKRGGDGGQYPLPSNLHNVPPHDIAPLNHASLSHQNGTLE
jgi:hypothetical protein